MDSNTAELPVKRGPGRPPLDPAQRRTSLPKTTLRLPVDLMFQSRLRARSAGLPWSRWIEIAIADALREDRP